MDASYCNDPEAFSEEAEEFEILLMQMFIDDPIDFLRQVYIKYQMN